MTPEQVLANYLSAMSSWETECGKLYRDRKSGKVDFAESLRIGIELGTSGKVDFAESLRIGIELGTSGNIRVRLTHST